MRILRVFGINPRIWNPRGHSVYTVIGAPWSVFLELNRAVQSHPDAVLVGKIGLEDYFDEVD
jgi:hypothetical protein